MKRKIIKQGNNTLTITLPRKWTTLFSIKAGDEIDIEEEGPRLIINTQTQITPTSLKFHLESSHRHYIHQVLRNLYISNVEDLEITYDDPKALLEIQKYSRRFLGWEFLEQDEEHCKIRNYATYNEENFNELYKKSFMTTIAMAELILKDLQYTREIEIEKIQNMKHTICRFINYCRKMLQKKPLITPAQNLAHSRILHELLVISAHFVYIVEFLDKDKKALISKPVLNYFQNVIDYYKLIYKMFLQKNMNELIKVAEMREKLQNEGMSIITKSKGADTIVMHYLLSIVIMIYSQGGRMMVIAKGL